MKEWQPLADQGHAGALYYLAKMYDFGSGVPEDEPAALKLYLKSASQGYASAQFNLGNMYANGRGVARNDEKAIKWFRKAADQGNSSAEWALTKMTKQGRVNDTAQNNSRYPSRPASKPGYNVCNTKCFNGNCYRTYADGRKVNFQAKQKWNPFTNQFEWDSGGC